MKKFNKFIMIGIIAFVFALSLAACGDNDTATQGLEYTLINNATAYSVAKGTATDTKIIIPSKYKGLPVTEIADNGFYEFSALKSVKMPNGITRNTIMRAYPKQMG